MQSMLGVGLLLFAATLPGWAQEALPVEPATRELDSVVVTGAQPGPGMWKVSKGEHELWILGTVSPLPRGIEWKSDQVREVLEKADQFLGPPGVVVDADVGLFRGMLLLPSALKATRNPDGKTLQEILPPASYARWAALKRRYIGRDGGVEKKRPFITAQELYEHAVKKSGLGGKVISPVIDPVIKRRKKEQTPTTLKLTVADPKAAIAEFRKEQMHPREIACMDEMMTMVERDLPRMVERANAWSIGDVDGLRALPLTERKSCWAAWAETETVRKRGLTDIEARIIARWVEVAETALQKNRVTFATLPMSELLKADGYLARLRAKGYTLEEPL